MLKLEMIIAGERMEWGSMIAEPSAMMERGLSNFVLIHNRCMMGGTIFLQGNIQIELEIPRWAYCQ